MKALLVALTLVGLLAAPASASEPTVNAYEYNHASLGLQKHDVHALFDTRGTWVAEWYDEVGDGHMWRNYPADDGTLVEVVYRKREGHQSWRLVERCRPPDAHTPCWKVSE